MPLLILLSRGYAGIYKRDVVESELIHHIFLSNNVNTHEREEFP